VLVTFNDGNERVTITQKANALDALGYMSMETVLDGRVPDLQRKAAKVTDFTQEFKRVSKGELPLCFFAIHTYYFIIFLTQLIYC
jgi:hypothetical protein